MVVVVVVKRREKWFAGVARVDVYLHTSCAMAYYCYYCSYCSY